MRARLSSAVVLLITALLCVPVCGAEESDHQDQVVAAGVDCECLKSTLAFDISSIEKIILEPETILENPQRFWEEDGAYGMVGEWHEINNLPHDMDGWIARIEERSKVTGEDRERDEQLVAARELAAIEQEFVDKAVKHLCLFLPPDAELSTTLYFTTDIEAAGFQQKGQIVVHIINHHLRNMFAHEVFHRGFASIYKKYVTTVRESDPKRLMYLMLQIEGAATYAAYRGIEVFPEIGEVGQSHVATDYDLLSQPEEVRTLHDKFLTLARQADDLEPNDLRQQSWQLGNGERAYYVLGAHMARTMRSWGEMP
jgi:hypothetical protein